MILPSYRKLDCHATEDPSSIEKAIYLLIVVLKYRYVYFYNFLTVALSKLGA